MVVNRPITDSSEDETETAPESKAGAIIEEAITTPVQAPGAASNGAAAASRGSSAPRPVAQQEPVQHTAEEPVQTQDLQKDKSESYELPHPSMPGVFKGMLDVNLQKCCKNLHMLSPRQRDTVIEEAMKRVETCTQRLVDKAGDYGMTVGSVVLAYGASDNITRESVCLHLPHVPNMSPKVTPEVTAQEMLKTLIDHIVSLRNGNDPEKEPVRLLPRHTLVLPESPMPTHLL